METKEFYKENTKSIENADPYTLSAEAFTDDIDYFLTSSNIVICFLFAAILLLAKAFAGLKKFRSV